SRVRDRVRDRRARARGGPASYARGAARAELRLLDQLVARPGLGRDGARDLQHRVRPGLGAYAVTEPELLVVVQLELQLRVRRPLFLGRRGRRRRWRWRSLVASSPRCSGTMPSWTARTPSGAVTPPRRAASRVAPTRWSSPARPTRSHACWPGATTTMSR